MQLIAWEKMNVVNVASPCVSDEICLNIQCHVSQIICCPASSCGQHICGVDNDAMSQINVLRVPKYPIIQCVVYQPVCCPD